MKAPEDKECYMWGGQCTDMLQDISSKSGAKMHCGTFMTFLTYISPNEQSGLCLKSKIICANYK